MTELYKADDGTIFEDEDDCIAYERACEMKDTNIYFATADGEQITIEEIATQSVSVEDIYYIKCTTYEDYEKMCDLFDELGYMYPRDWGDRNTSDARCWYWDENVGYGDWVNLRTRIINELEKLKSILEKVLNA